MDGRLQSSRLNGQALTGLILVLGFCGCHREFFRHQADVEVSELIAEKSADPQWALPEWTVEPDPLSRFVDPDGPNHPWMPEDDPAAACLSPRPQHADGVSPLLESTAYLQLMPQTSEAPGRRWQEQLDPLDDPESDAPVRILSQENALLVGLVNSRDYQDRKESLYLAALDVSLERFAFAPQFFAAESLLYDRLTAERNGGASSSSLGIQPAPFSGTRVAPGRSPNARAVFGQSVGRFAGAGPSAGSGIGVGRLFATGGALLLRFANQTVWEFSGPLKGHLSQSDLSLDLVQPLLQGGGRAVTLEPLTQAERNLLYELRAFARFQREFFVSIATGSRLNQGARLENSQQADESQSGGRRRVGLLPLIEQLQVLRNEERNLTLLKAHQARFEAFQRAGEVSSIQVDQVRQNVAQARSRVLKARRRYFANLDRFKLQLGLPTQLKLVVDDSLLAAFELDDKKCEMPQLPVDLPIFEYEPAEALSMALSNRLDLMNARAQLVDYWRKIAVSANGLLGVADLEYQASWLTPDPTTTSRPLAFSGQRTRHRLTLNTELPLVRKEERNIYRATLIEYQRARRRLMESVDVVQLEVRNELREIERARQDYAIQRQAVVLACRRVDQASRVLELPPRPGERRELGTNSARDLLEAQQDLVDALNDLVRAWVDYQTVRLELKRDLELLDMGRSNLIEE